MIQSFGLHPEKVRIESLSESDARRLLFMLDMARDMHTPDTHPNASLISYTSSVLFGREGGFTLFRNGGGEAVAMTHTTTAGRLLELDALARMPHVRDGGLGARALEYTISQAHANGQEKVGLYTPERNLGFYAAYGFVVADELAIEGYGSQDYARMEHIL